LNSRRLDGTWRTCGHASLQQSGDAALDESLQPGLDGGTGTPGEACKVIEGKLTTSRPEDGLQSFAVTPATGTPELPEEFCLLCAADS
jgi:hypothetical protein